MERRLYLVLTIVSGAAAGFAGSLLARQPGQSTTSDSTPEPVAAAAPLTLDSRGHSSADQAAWLRSQHEQRLQQVEDSVKQLHEAPVEEVDEQADVENLDLEAVREEAYARWAERLDQHETEPIDASWSSTATTQFEQDMNALSASESFELLRTQCRTNTCSATVQWTSYAGALDHYSALLHADYKTSCAREVVLPEPEQRDAPYQATVLFDCSELRAAGTASRRGT